jgi:hypothetical protein
MLIGRVGQLCACAGVAAKAKAKHAAIARIMAFLPKMSGRLSRL